MAKHIEQGQAGEKMAVNHLLSNGYSILEINWRHKKDEIDIICTKNNSLIIVEVKTRSTSYFGTPETFVSVAKQKNIIRATQAYIDIKNLDLEVQFDVISIIRNRKTSEINHLENAFYPMV